jgi:ubiquinone/menaquinone biosynthesis C-methylase UbiE
MAHVCPWWFAYTFDNPVRRLFHKPEEMFIHYVKEGQVVADIGCGMGYFSLGLAKLVKERGRVYSIDIQEQMLSRVTKRAAQAGLSDIIIPQLIDPRELCLKEQLDFALAFWMVHETGDIEHFLKQVHDGLKDGGLLLITEPKFHVSHAELNEEIKLAEGIGFEVKERPHISFSHTVLLGKG